MITINHFHSLPVPIAQLSLSAVLKCGQSFRWHAIPIQEDGNSSSKLQFEYHLALKDRVVCLKQNTDTLFYRALYPSLSNSRSEYELDSETLVWLKDYFQLDIDLVALYDDWSSKDAVFNRLRNRFEGIRILRQDPWENLISSVPTQYI